MAEVLVDRIRQGVFAQHHHLLQGLLLDGAHKPFAVGVHIRTAGRQEDRFHTTVLEQRIKRLRELRVPVVDQRAFAQQEPLERVRQLASTLLHEGRGGMRGDAGALDTPCRQLHHHEHVVHHETMLRRHLDCEKVRGGEHLPV